jgi:AraC-like DNA-binding protein
MNGQLPAIDYVNLSNAEHTRDILGARDVNRLDLYGSSTDARYTFSSNPYRGLLEVAKLHPDVLLILNHCRNYPPSVMTQLIGTGHWMHLQFRLRGVGEETLGSVQIKAPENAFLVTSYPSETAVLRRSEASVEQKTACIYMRPSAIEQFFGIASDAFPAHLRWIADGANADPRYHLQPLQRTSFSAVDDMLACTFNGAARKTYMRAKSCELLAEILHAVADVENTAPNQMNLNSRDIQAVVNARDIIHERIECTLSLAELAALVGLNRNKLAVGFKRVFDVPVQVYWRDLKLLKARDLLRSSELSVTEVGWRMGYAETSSFSRAFTAKFGISPRRLRSNAAGAHFALERDTR